MERRWMSSIARGWVMVIAAFALGGCEMAILDPKGDVARHERDLILGTTGWMLVVVIPVIVMTIAFAWWYRASNTKSRYTPEWSHSKRLEAVLWGIPTVIVVVMAITAWRSTHALDPFKPLDHPAKPIEIEVVALDWKWLFIYPEQGIATVNEVAFPANVPVTFAVTSDAVMNSFFIPSLGSQIYAMAGMKTQVHLIANAEGVYFGMSAQYSGRGFSGMRFAARAMTQQDFDAWVAQARQAQDRLDWDTYPALAKPSENHPVTYYGAVIPGLFDGIVGKYRAHHSDNR